MDSATIELLGFYDELNLSSISSTMCDWWFHSAIMVKFKIIEKAPERSLVKHIFVLKRKQNQIKLLHFPVL